MNASTLAFVDRDRDPLDLLAEEFADRYRRGETPSITEYATRHPELADDLRELLPAVAQMEMLKRYRHSFDAHAGNDVPIEPPPTQLGDFSILRELGRGGMGIVYEAVQQSLGRRVALKVLPPAARRDTGKRERFLREAHAAARLHHTNIVPVFGVGEANGTPYFVMQYISGCGLNDVLHGWHTPQGQQVDGSSPILQKGQWQAIARLIADAANAIEYANEQGILHRDVKPGNLLLDARGNVWVADFGLAKLIDRETMTATGDLLGTVQYMAPESLNGHADRRTDVYGLGMTLYELVTGELPYNESTPAALIRAITESDPATPRTIVPKVPKDLETIVLKAIAREPDRRYQTAGELAEDLTAFVHDLPIRARRSSVSDRLYRSCRRNPVIAALSFVTLAVLIFSAAFGWISNARTNEALAKESRLRKDAEDANGKLSASLDLSLATLEKLFDTIGNIEPPFQRTGGPDGRGPPEGRGPDGKGPPEGGPPKRGQIPKEILAREAGNRSALLEVVLGFYEKFAEQNSTNPKMQLDAAAAYRRVGEMNLQLQNQDKSADAYKRSTAIVDALLLQNPHAPELLCEYIASASWAPLPAQSDPAYADRVRRLHVAYDYAEELRPQTAIAVNRFAMHFKLLYIRLSFTAFHEAKYEDADKYRKLAEAEEKRMPPPPPFDDRGPRGPREQPPRPH